MKMQMQMTQKGVPEDIEPYENAKKFVNSELIRLDSHIDILEQILDLIYEAGVDAETFQSSRTEQYRKIKDCIPDECINLIHNHIKAGASFIEALKNLQAIFEDMVKSMKKAYRSHLELKLKLEDIEE